MLKYPLFESTSLYNIHKNTPSGGVLWKSLGRMTHIEAESLLYDERELYTKHTSRDPMDIFLVREMGSEEPIKLPSWDVYLKTGPLVTYLSIDEEEALRRLGKMCDEWGLCVDSFVLERKE